MPVKLNIATTEAGVLTSLAKHFIQTGQEAISARGRFSVSLSGGSSPKKLYEMLASADYRDQLDWTKVDFFFGDERNVPQDDKESNYLMAKTALFDPLNIAHENIFAVNTSSGPEGASAEYAITIFNYFKGEEMVFDLVLLGLGDDAHTASLFPHTSILQDRTASVREVYLHDKQVFRISMTYRLINQARHIAFLVYGPSKAEAVHHALEDAPNTDLYPAQLISKETDQQWFLDEAAAAKLEKK